MDQTNRLILVLAAIFGIMGFMMSSYLMNDGSKLVGNSAPALELKLINGSSQSLASLRGKPVLINVWATWCPPCVEEMPMLDVAHRSGKIHVIAIAHDERAAVEQFLRRKNFAFDMALGESAPSFDGDYAVPNVIPYSVMINREGEVTAVKRGLLSQGELDSMIAGAL
jgi:thiol-disulfide isomerase/thioredoxin